MDYSYSSIVRYLIGLTKINFTLLLRYFFWANQSTAVIALWVGAMYLFISKKNYWKAMIPEIFHGNNTYILNVAIGLGLPMNIFYNGASIATAALIIALIYKATMKARANNLQLDDDANIAA
jgi:carbon starvation protein CstA